MSSLRTTSLFAQRPGLACIVQCRRGNALHRGETDALLHGRNRVPGERSQIKSGSELSNTRLKPRHSIASEPPAPAAMANSEVSEANAASGAALLNCHRCIMHNPAVPDANAASGAALKKYQRCIMCHKPKAQLLADAPDTNEWRLRAKSCPPACFRRLR